MKLQKSLVFALLFSLSTASSTAFAMAKKPLSSAVSAGSGASAPNSSSDQHSYTVGHTSLNTSLYNHVDPKRLIPSEALNNAIRFYDLKKARISNQRYITIIDMTQTSKSKRMYVLNMESGEVATYFSSHGAGSDTNNDTYAERFSNVSGSRMTSLGFYLTGSSYQGEHGTSMIMYGLEKTNSNANDRAIVMHGADYVSSSHTGRSWGCPAVEMKYISGLVSSLKGGSLIYIYRR